MRIRTASIEIDWKTPQHHGRPREADLQSARAQFPGAGRDLAADRRRQSLAVAAAGARRAGLRVRPLLPASARRSAWSRRAKLRPYPGHRLPARWSRPGPALEGRFEFFHNLDDERRLEIAPGFHTSRLTSAASRFPPALLAGLVLQSVRAAWSSPAHFTRAKTWRRWATATARASVSTTDATSRQWTASAAGARSRCTPLPRLDLHLFTGQQDDRQPRIERRPHRQESAVRRQPLLSPGAECHAGTGSHTVADHVYRAGRPHQQPL